MYEVCPCVKLPPCAYREQKSQALGQKPSTTQDPQFKEQCTWDCSRCFECPQDGCVVDSTSECMRCLKTSERTHKYVPCAHKPREIDKQIQILSPFKKLTI